MLRKGRAGQAGQANHSRADEGGSGQFRAGQDKTRQGGGRQGAGAGQDRAGQGQAPGHSEHSTALHIAPGFRFPTFSKVVHHGRQGAPHAA